MPSKALVYSPATAAAGVAAGVGVSTLTDGPARPSRDFGQTRLGVPERRPSTRLTALDLRADVRSSAKSDDVGDSSRLASTADRIAENEPQMPATTDAHAIRQLTSGLIVNVHADNARAGLEPGFADRSPNPHRAATDQNHAAGVIVENSS